MTNERHGVYDYMLRRWARLKHRKALVEAIVDFDSASGFVVEEDGARRFVPFEDTGMTRAGAAQLIRRLWSDAVEDQLQALERLLIAEYAASEADFKRALAVYDALHGGGEAT